MSHIQQLILAILILVSPLTGCLNNTQEDSMEVSDSCSFGDNFISLESRVSEHTLVQEIDGEQVIRRYLIQAPSIIESSKCYPIIFALHGNGGQPDHFVGQFRDMIDDGEFIGIYPEGIERSWNLGKEASTANDTQFIESIADSLQSFSNIDHERRYVIGFSKVECIAHTLGV